MSLSPMTPDEQYATCVEALVAEPAVTLGSPGRKGFGSSALQVNGKIFVMLVGDRLVVKPPRARVDTLVDAGETERLGPAPGRVMKGWVTVDGASGECWLPLAREALAFVGLAGER